MNKAIAVSALGDKRGALALYDQAVAIRERLVNQEGRHELAGELAQSVGYRGSALIALGEKARGIEDMCSAENVLTVEIAHKGRADLQQTLTWIRQRLKTEHPN